MSNLKFTHNSFNLIVNKISLNNTCCMLAECWRSSLPIRSDYYWLYLFIFKSLLIFYHY